MKLPHLIHRDRRWQIRGLFAYYECRCGARRIRWVNRGMCGPPEPGWPELQDKHGAEMYDSGWKRKAA
jgi:hypothetical protein